MPSTNNNRSVLTSIYNTMQTTIDNLATKFRNKTDDLLETMLGISIDGLCDNNLKNRRFMERLMRLNVLEKDTTMNLLGNDAMPYGNSRMLDTNSVHPSYTSDVDYVKNYMQYRYDDNVRKTDVNPSSFNDYGNGNELYTRTQNLFPDELDALTGTYSNHVWQIRNRDSILSKTKNLFNANKINTIISGFCTSHGEGGVTDDTDAKSQYGMSHGRNLLLKRAETDGGNGNYNINGYNNPYCRVWTHHYQYDRLDKLIRPFVTVDGDRGDNNIGEPITKREFHKWSNFSSGSNAYWKKDNIGWDYSVLNDNGFVNIAPKYDSEQDKKIHAKQCMFSIENLAWKGYDPYSFERALSWEQRGPMGGRIMWFPPYGIQFNETTQANWTNHTFIGRGEDVYTYTNTIRSGNLSFLMVVDHPSIIDYVSWHGGNGGEVKDSDLLRFFAGCDDGTVRDATKPTPLTDEAIQSINVQEYTEATPAPLPQPPIEPEIPEDIQEIIFYVFYPNNYSGVYDMMGDKSRSNKVEAIAYLLCGNNAQKDINNNYEDIALSLDTMSDFNGNGYEMGQGSVTVSDGKTGPIIGARMAWRTALNKGVKTYPASSGDNLKQWQYRIDGEYVVPKSSEVNKNTYDQTLLVKSNYQDRADYGLNVNAEQIKSLFNDDNDEYVYSLAEVAAAIGDDNVKTYLINNKGVNEERVNTLYDILTTYEITAINGIGYSNSHGNNANRNTNNNRNSLLAVQRIDTVVDWFNNQRMKNMGKESVSGNKDIVDISSDPSKGVSTQDVSRLDSKKYRSARMTLVLKKSEKKKESETSQSSTDADGNTVSTGTQKFIGYTTKTDANGIQYFQNDTDGSCWMEVTDENDPHYGELMKISLEDNMVSNGNYWTKGGIRANAKIEVDRNGNVTSVSSSGEVNDIRYDQEYYFFKALKQSDPIVFDKLMTKIQYFDPVFHSMTPEGFSARLTFLQQCTRQGDTIGASDTTNSMTPNNTASNLAFGRPPFCVLRLGDFYNQMIVIDNISINYEPLMWDLNIEGAGVIPLLANVTISFKFIGGGDMTGPVRRLQNAMSFNYYSNGRLYDNRSDRVVYKSTKKYGIEQGAIDNELDTESSEFYTAAYYKGDRIDKKV